MYVCVLAAWIFHWNHHKIRHCLYVCCALGYLFFGEILSRKADQVDLRKKQSYFLANFIIVYSMSEYCYSSNIRDVSHFKNRYSFSKYFIYGVQIDYLFMFQCWCMHYTIYIHFLYNIKIIQVRISHKKDYFAATMATNGSILFVIWLPLIRYFPCLSFYWK